MSDEPETQAPLTKAPRDRSPSYPNISLKSAIDRLERFEATFGRHPAPFKKAGVAWGITEGSSQANSVLAALKAYGLLIYEGSGESRQIAVSDEGRTYLRAHQDEIKKGVIRRAALKPKAFAMFWPIWGADRPIDAICLDDLVLKHGFNENAAPTFLRVYDETIAFAGLGDSDKGLEEADEFSNESEDRFGGASVGDLIQWESGGVLKLSQPARVLAVHESGDWVFVEGSTTGIPMNEVIVENVVTETAPPAPPMPPTPGPALIGGATVAMPSNPSPFLSSMATDGEEKEWVRTPLGKGAHARILVTDDLTDAQIDKLCAVLGAMKEGD